MQELFTTKSLTYLPKPNRQTLQLLKEFEQIQSLEKRTKEQESRYQELLKDDPVAKEIRVTVGTINARRYAAYRSYVTSARSWFEREAGMPANDFLEDVPPESDEYQYLFSLLTMCHAWASIYSSLQKCESRDSHLFSGKETEWIETPIPSTWKKVESFLDAVPTDLLWSLDALANDVNPNLWHVAQDDVSKKFGVTSAT